jgi:hypothetical protein
MGLKDQGRAGGQGRLLQFLYGPVRVRIGGGPGEQIHHDRHARLGTLRVGPL